jgi:hypothetical protein
MRTNIRLRLDMAGRAMEFCRAHPDQNPSTALVATRLSDLVARATTLSQQQRASLVTAAAAVNRKNELRETIGEHLAALAGISKAASATQPGLTVHRRLPRGRTSEPTFLTIARVAVAEATASKELFLKFGMPDTLLETMTAELDEYEAAVSRQRNGLATQVGAGAELDSVTAEIMGVVKHLDSLHRLRFKGDPELRAGWKSARNVAWRIPQPEPVTTEPQPGLTPPADTPSADTPKAA